ncbi:Mre11 DNA-binding presumed domain-containing protein [Dipodascopsis tothii]|uniref:Mre11 DNA-binding presumed domain-containing protein n=1 Tax=Dipodascopsis tothii TaxID=44089 RepID=UPI0034CDDF81
MPRIANTSSGPNTIRILLSSDNHVGYNERDPIRGDDSWKTFDEVMTIAKDKEVDMVLLAGDLFHENKPSRKAMYQVAKSLRTTCYGDKPCELELLSDPKIALSGWTENLNYEDPDINVAIPVMSISGNHDDASGDAFLAPLDVLAATGLINHFGRVAENDNITVAPLLFRKGYTKLALYGMSNVRDERLHRTFRDHNVKFLRPAREQFSSTDEWFNLMAVHQNHHAHTNTNYLPEEFLPSFLDLVIWGHEHECLMDPQMNAEREFSVIQPGSSVATSLCEGEAVEKFVGLLSITGQDFQIEKIKLKTVRPFVMKEVVLAEDCSIKPSAKNKSHVLRWLMEQVELLIDEARANWKEANGGKRAVADEDVPLPLVRLRVEYSGGYEVENPRRFSNRFVGKVANVNDVVQFYKRKSGTVAKRAGTKDNVRAPSGPEDLENLRVQSLVEEFLKNQKLDVLAEAGLNDAISQYVDKDDRYAIKTFVDDSLDVQMQNLLTLGEDPASQDEDEEAPASKKRARPESRTEAAAVPKKVARGKAAPKAAPKTKATRSKKKQVEVPASDEDSADDIEMDFGDDDEEEILEDSSDAPSTTYSAPTRRTARSTARKPAADPEESREPTPEQIEDTPPPPPRTTSRAKASASKAPKAAPKAKTTASGRRTLPSTTAVEKPARSRRAAVPAASPSARTRARPAQQSQLFGGSPSSQRAPRAAQAKKPLEIISDDDDDGFE